ncbi:MAG: branched-chain alpha-keto acid dehydrogenase subunit E2 [Ignavibacteria bacterium RBG_13_36_8]|nr:MAG: branched-chain alpha-keto acid dehydrogenase subunit E2 [Ignavibacteria bacterium RBG_13_36_8]
MLVEFKLPILGENIESADVTKVLVSVGDKVSSDQPVIEIETDKATVEVPVEISGIVKEVRIKDGEKIKVGQVILIIETTGSPANTTQAGEKTKVAEPLPVETKEVDKKIEPTVQVKSDTSKIVSGKYELPEKLVPASPAVRRFAREIGIDIYQVPGSGPGGRISIDDLKSFAKNLNERVRQTTTSGIYHEPLPDFTKWGMIDRQPMSNIRKKTAQHLSLAWATIPHVTQFDKADINELEKLRKEFGKRAEEAGGKLTVTAVLLKIVSAALKVFPQFNSSIDVEKNEIIYKKYYNIGVAVDTEHGLLVPVIKNIDKKNIVQLAVELTEISRKARDKKLSLEEMQGGTFSISNLGGIGGTYFTPIVNSPEVAILGVSRASYEPIYKGEKFEPSLLMPLSLSYDHRIIDGADAIRFLRWIVNALEEPFLLSLEG